MVVRGRLDPAPAWQVHPSFSLGVVILLVLMSSGVTEMFGVYIADTVHWVGLAVGAIAAAAWRPTRPGSDDAV